MSLEILSWNSVNWFLPNMGLEFVGRETAKFYAYLDTALTIDHQIHFFDLHSICFSSWIGCISMSILGERVDLIQYVL